MTLYRNLNYDRETKEDRFARYIGENNFKVLIEAWRTPDPRPASIKVELSSDPIDAELLDRKIIEKNPKLKYSTIVQELRRIEEKIHSIRYDPKYTRNDWQIGSFYLQEELEDDYGGDKLYIKIDFE